MYALGDGLLVLKDTYHSLAPVLGSCNISDNCSTNCDISLTKTTDNSGQNKDGEVPGEDPHTVGQEHSKLREQIKLQIYEYSGTDFEGNALTLCGERKG